MIGQMTAVHNVSMRIDISVGFQLPFAVSSLTPDEGFGVGFEVDLKVRAVLIGKEAVEGMIALVRTGVRHVDGLSPGAVEVASYDPDQRDGLSHKALVEHIEVVLAVHISAESRRCVEGEEQ